MNPRFGPRRLIEQRQRARPRPDKGLDEMSCAADKSSIGWETRIAPARMSFTRGAYLGLERNVSW